MSTNKRVGMMCDSLSERPLIRSSNRITPYSQTQTGRAAEFYGANIAYKEFNTAMLEWWKDTSFVLVAPPSAVSRIRRQLQAFDQEVRERVEVWNYFDLPKAFEQVCWTGWLDDSGYFPCPFDLRSAFAGRAYPIVLSHHSIGYQIDRHNNFTALLLSDTEAYDALVCTSSDAKRMIESILNSVSESLSRSHNCQLKFRGELPVIPLGVDTDFFRPRSKEKGRDHFSLQREELIVLYFGRVSTIDKADLFPMVQVFNAVRRRNPQIKLRLVIAGNTAYGYSHILTQVLGESGLSDYVTFIDCIRDEELPLLYSSADIFISPADNRQECFGQTVVEAMSCGIPQIASDWSGHRDTVVHGQTGFLIPTLWMKCDSDLELLSQVYHDRWQGDHFRMSQSVAMDNSAAVRYLDALIVNGDLRAKMSEASFTRARDLYSWRYVSTQYSNLTDHLSLECGKKPNRSANPSQYRRARSFDSTFHFASILLDDDTQVELTSLLDAGGHDIRSPYSGRYLDFEEFGSWQLSEVCKLLSGRLPVGPLLAGIVKRTGCSRDSACRQVMWLIKYGYIGKVNR